MDHPNGHQVSSYWMVYYGTGPEDLTVMDLLPGFLLCKVFDLIRCYVAWDSSHMDQTL